MIETLKKTAQNAVAALRQAGADKAQASVAYTVTHEFNVDGGEFSLFRTLFDKQLAMTAIQGGRKGTVAQNRYDEDTIAATAKGGDVNKFTRSVEKYLSDIRLINPEAMDIPFIANHDTDRAAGYLSMSNGRMQVAANLYLLSPGSPFIYYGEEIGLRGSRGGASTDANRRLAML